MEVLLKGGPWTIDVRCCGDGCQSECCYSSLRLRATDFYLFYRCSEHKVYYLCCVCGAQNAIPRDLIPRRLQYNWPIFSDVELRRAQEANWARIREEQSTSVTRGVYENL